MFVWCGFGDGGGLCGQYDFVECFLWFVEFVVGWEGVGDVGGVVVQFVVGVDQDQVVVFDFGVVCVIVQYVAVGIGGDDGVIGWIL